MQATIIYNQQAGAARGIDPEALGEPLRAAGYHPVVRATENEAELSGILDGIQGLVIAIGGDGTLRAVALHLIGRGGVELALVPAGTANNIARAWQLVGSADELVAGLPGGTSRPFDVGRLRGPLGEHFFLEACGCGVFADALAQYGPEDGKSVTRALGTLADILPGYEAHQLEAALDGAPVSGRYILLEALNTPATGPRLNLAPDASPSDGLLDVTGVLESERHSLLEYARKIGGGELPALDNVVVTRARRLELVWTGFPIHLDGEVLTDIEDPDAMQRVRVETPELAEQRRDVLSIECLPGALTLRLPAGAAEASDG